MFIKTHNDRNKDTCVYPESSRVINLKVIIFSLRGKVPVAHRSCMPIKSQNTPDLTDFAPVTYEGDTNWHAATASFWRQSQQQRDAWGRVM